MMSAECDVALCLQTESILGGLHRASTERRPSCPHLYSPLRSVEQLCSAPYLPRPAFVFPAPIIAPLRQVHGRPRHERRGP